MAGDCWNRRGAPGSDGGAPYEVALPAVVNQDRRSTVGFQGLNQGHQGPGDLSIVFADPLEASGRGQAVDQNNQPRVICCVDSDALNALVVKLEGVASREQANDQIPS